MKSLKKLFFTTLLSQLLTGFLNPTPVFAESSQIKVTVNGMVCSFCAQGITKKFKAEDAIETVDVKLSKHLVLLTEKTKKEISSEKIKSILIESGYSVEKIER